MVNGIIKIIQIIIITVDSYSQKIFRVCHSEHKDFLSYVMFEKTI